MDELLTTKNAAKLLAVTSETVRIMIKEGRLQAVNLNANTGKRATWRVRMSSILSLIEKKEPRIMEAF